MILLFDNNLSLLTEVKDDVVEAQQTVELNAQTKSIIRILQTSFNQNTAYFGYKFDNNFYLYKITDTKKDGPIIEIQGIHIFFDELKGRVVRDLRPTNVTALQVTESLLNELDWSITSDASGLFSSNFYHVSLLDAFYDILEKWHCEFELKLSFVGGKLKKSIHLSNRISKDFGKWYEYGDKLITVVAEENHADIYTAFIGRGKGEETESGGFGRKLKFSEIEWSVNNGDPVNKPSGQDYVEIESATKLYGYPDGSPRIGVIDFDEIENAEELLLSTYQYAVENARPKLHLKAQAYENNRIEIGETATIIRPDINIRYKTRIFKCVTDLLTKQQTFEFGEPLSVSVGQRFKAQAKQVDKKVTELVESKMQTVINNINIDYYNEDGFNYELKANNDFELPAGYYSFDKPIDQSPTKVVYMGAGKVLIADELDPNGQWVWRTAITPEGLVGSEIISNSLIADQIESGTLSSKDGTSWLNLDNGSFSFGDGVLSFSKENGFSITLTDSIKQEIESNQKHVWLAYTNESEKNITDGASLSWREYSTGGDIDLEDNHFSLTGASIEVYIDHEEFIEGNEYSVSFNVTDLNKIIKDIRFSNYEEVTEIYFDNVLIPIPYDGTTPLDISDGIEHNVLFKFISNGNQLTALFYVEELSDATIDVWDFHIKKTPPVVFDSDGAVQWGFANEKDTSVPSTRYGDYTWHSIFDEEKVKSIRSEFVLNSNEFKVAFDSIENNGNKLEQISKYLTFSSETGEIILGETNSPVQWVQTNEKVSFVAGGVELASWTTEEMKVKRLTVDDLFVALKIYIGNHIIEKYGNDKTIVRRIN